MGPTPKGHLSGIDANYILVGKKVMGNLSEFMWPMSLIYILSLYLRHRQIYNLDFLRAILFLF